MATRGIDFANLSLKDALDLAIARRLTEAHGGRVFARNAESGGAIVGFELPIGSPSRAGSLA